MVGVVMKDARWRDYLRRGFFPAVPQSGICFRRVTAQDALADDTLCDILLIKVTPPGSFLRRASATLYHL